MHSGDCSCSLIISCKEGTTEVQSTQEYTVLLMTWQLHQESPSQVTTSTLDNEIKKEESIRMIPVHRHQPSCVRSARKQGAASSLFFHGKVNSKHE